MLRHSQICRQRSIWIREISSTKVRQIDGVCSLYVMYTCTVHSYDALAMLEVGYHNPDKQDIERTDQTNNTGRTQGSPGCPAFRIVRVSGKFQGGNEDFLKLRGYNIIAHLRGAKPLSGGG